MGNVDETFLKFITLFYIFVKQKVAILCIINFVLLLIPNNK